MSPLHWTPPEPENWKLNVNGAIFPDQHNAGVGYVLRNELGRVIAVVTQPELHFTEPIEVELLAIFCGKQFCAPLGIPNITVETDWLLTV